MACARVGSRVVSPSERDLPTIVLVRHGATEWSTSGRHTSRTDVPLTDAGRRDAERLRERLAGFDFALVLTSPMSRAHETAAIAGFGDRAEVDGDLCEFDYGEYEGRTTAEIREERPGWDVWRDDSPGGETPAQVGKRADRVIERVLGAGGDVALFAHGHLLRVLAARWMGVEAGHGGNLGLSTGAVCELGFERERRAIWVWNDTTHLG
jgi:broad specificity phosphatase PhoE